jgi:hypothetical protein
VIGNRGDSTAALNATRMRTQRASVRCLSLAPIRYAKADAFVAYRADALSSEEFSVLRIERRAEF